MGITAIDYVTAALGVAHRAAESQAEAVEQAAQLICDRLERGGDFWVFGTGHSHLLAEEIWGRAGGIVGIRPILEPSLMLHEGLEKSSKFERLPALGRALLELYPIQPDDVLLVASNSGRNAVPVELAEGARELGALVIALTSLAHSKAVASRAPSGNRLFEIAHLVLDNCGVPGDAIIDHDPVPVGPTSTVVGALLAQALSVAVIGEMDRRGHALPTYVSLNV